MVHEATASAPVNIACIKYWGKRDTRLILPTNSSLSVTLDQDHLRSTTTSRADASFEAGDRLWLNGREEAIKEGGRLAVCIKELRAWRKEMETKDKNLPKLSEWPLRIASYNNFPTAAGLASSASGLAALVASLASLYSLPQSPSQLSLVARQGSGSACRSLFGGFVAWREGTDPAGSDSLAEEVAAREHWPEMHALICVVSDAKKGTSSTSGMQKTVETSTLLQERLRVVPKRMDAISQAIKARDFAEFAKLTMADSNSFHAVCLDTAPPIFYLNDVSRAIIAVVEELNRAAGEIIAAYTFDAGPNAVIYTLEKNMPFVLGAIKRFFPTSEEFESPFQTGVRDLPEGFNTGVVREGGWEKGAVKGLIHTRVGDGPRVLEKEDSLLGENGVPKILA
ncbi:diphosphomevalonate decarboxylase [Cryptococcus neoformans AD2-60a]|uniref:Diphosphomevalonate decarboxylase n=1 Tax=Cryptococcus neoformans Tu259-1 TaxID=1230072 RepID=A0A854QMR6_CRYNE|nr:diphosphomevalonate decarboxylase [Cryptococcus neoformans var. grubii AD2-60a]OWZ55153.1 diphosphomevalonate decarboxylase [Cryptococcus neoformans var. grubii 125.91]OXC85404.1 diphosphomevalonate decarboxylase [Cryptococcus neoformans var. grubii AD1-7a]OXG23981.1 diphosphomevalonate decarboxylase [Cryptococcus neoformans var. grubii Tu259-1]OXG83944.1 diphosphomevalonate decarboxylase [Cryptococcus neoformans var. grubii MW-RSA36]OXL09441.1 diphosphomevalonate decarboxylase [Cryptococcu